MKVLKFGGTSVGTPQSIQSIISIVKENYTKGTPMALVHSAFSKVTDQLIEMAENAASGKDYLGLFEAYVKRHQDAAQQLVTDHTLDELFTILDEHHDTLKNLLQG
ncbi:MAG TPA: bifunctional aspartate kinase/homoserine dehydrogenase I, partial [Saprospiraceae bacterium]|nr:bifunctional aspartate kinase/homoserine dehydrogenase I [Saprospiraceae bacterium]